MLHLRFFYSLNELSLQHFGHRIDRHAHTQNGNDFDSTVFIFDISSKHTFAPTIDASPHQ